MLNKVLIVEDDPVLCNFIQEVLGSAEMEAHAETDSTQAAVRLREEKFDAVFLDVRMPPPDGIELAQQMRASRLNRTTPIVIITGEGERGLMTRAFQAGANFFLFKPVDRTRLLQLIRVTQGSIQREKRRFRRVKVNCKVSIESGQHRLNGRTLDLSLNGMLVQATRVLPVGSLVQVSLELSPTTPPMRAAARVVRVIGDDCMGLQLENAGMTESKRLQEFLLPLISTTIDEDS
jgi:DNA-binding response OmpR family regulator